MLRTFRSSDDRRYPWKRSDFVMDLVDIRHETNLDHLYRLHRWMSFKLAVPVLIAAWFVIPIGLIVTSLRIAAVLLSPYILYVLVRQRRWGWVIGFLVTVGIPFILALVPQESITWSFVLDFIPLATFLLYSLVLRHALGEWLEEARFESTSSGI